MRRGKGNGDEPELRCSSCGKARREERLASWKVPLALLAVTVRIAGWLWPQRVHA
jgi:hypothetical protein